AASLGLPPGEAFVLLRIRCSPVTRTESHMETYKTVSQDIGDQLNAEAEAIKSFLHG
nr:hypothetical protein [Tanacetum cinerariifolium]